MLDRVESIFMKNSSPRLAIVFYRVSIARVQILKNGLTWKCFTAFVDFGSWFPMKYRQKFASGLFLSNHDHRKQGSNWADQKKLDETHLETSFSPQHLLRTIQFALLLFISRLLLAVPYARGSWIKVNRLDYVPRTWPPVIVGSCSATSQKSQGTNCA